VIHAARRDPGEPEIVRALRSRGCFVHLVKGEWGIPDLLVFAPDGRIVLLEVKSPPGPRGGTKHEKGQHLNEKQAEIFAEAHKRGAPVFVVHDVDEALGRLESP
jgi:hypothetical protein